VREPYYDDGQAVLYQGDVLDVLREMPAESVQTCVTSPPYFGLRDYGTATWEGGLAACSHGPTREAVIAATMRQTTLNVGLDGLSENQMAGASARMAKSPCPRCGAIRIDSQIGLESTPEEYVAKMVEVFREVRRVLRKDGTLWMNIGDSYAGAATNGEKRPGWWHVKGGLDERGRRDRNGMGAVPGLKPKDLVGIPWMVAFALRADGWYLRSDIIWAKPNPMPESVSDRPTKSHEYIFLLSKAEKYYYDAEAIREEGEGFGRSERFRDSGYTNNHSFDNSGKHQETGGGRSLHDGTGRNKRSVWTVATQPYPEAHFATFPEDLIKPCILAGCPEGGIVLDPFVGSGTTCWVSKSLGRRSVGIDLSLAYLGLAVERNRQLALW
jgi:DNA modification methylase